MPSGISTGKGTGILQNNKNNTHRNHTQNGQSNSIIAKEPKLITVDQKLKSYTTALNGSDL